MLLQKKNEFALAVASNDFEQAAGLILWFAMNGHDPVWTVAMARQYVLHPHMILAKNSLQSLCHVMRLNPKATSREEILSITDLARNVEFLKTTLQEAEQDLECHMAEKKTLWPKKQK